MEIVAIANLKGGVGKTTTTQNLGTALATAAALLDRLAKRRTA